MAEIILADEKTEGLKKFTEQASGWQKFKFLYKSQPSITKPNVSMLLFFVPLLLIIMYMGTMQTRLEGALPYGSYIGVGYPLSLYINAEGAVAARQITRLTLLFITAGALLFSVALAGALKTVRNAVVTLKVDQKRDNKAGIKENWLVCLITVLIWCAVANGIYYLFEVLAKADIGVWSTVIKIAALISAAFTLVWGFYVMCLAAGYRQNILRIVINAYHMIFESLFLNFLALVFTLLPFIPIILFGGYIVNLLVLMYYAMIGFAATVYVWMNLSVKFENRYSKYRTVSET